MCSSDLGPAAAPPRSAPLTRLCLRLCLFLRENPQHHLVAQDEFLHLAGHRHRKLIDEFDIARHLVMGDLALAEGAQFLGRQAGVIAYGSPGGLRFTWKEETDDFGNEPVVAAGTILGVSKVKFNERDFGVISVDTAATDPNA
mgnify:CR=1 FL=1